MKATQVCPIRLLTGSVAVETLQLIQLIARRCIVRRTIKRLFTYLPPIHRGE